MLFALTHKPRMFSADAVHRYDPTGTGKIRRKFEGEMVRRFRRLRSLIIEAVVKADVLGLKPNPTFEEQLKASLFNQNYKIFRDAEAPPRNAYKFNRPQEKVQSFMDWLYQAQADEILSVSVGTPVRQAANSAWENVYIDSAYQKGIRDAGDKMKKAGARIPDGWVESAFNRPVHADRAGLIYTRAYTDLEGITDTMAARISSQLARGIAEGKGPQQMARDLTKSVDQIGITRSRTLVRTEVISAHADATLNTFEEARDELGEDITGVEIEAEFTTAGDDEVCPQCEELEGNIMSIEEARGIIPVHPNCRCAYLPVVK